MRHGRTLEELCSRQDEVKRNIAEQLKEGASQITGSLRVLADNFEEATKSKDGMASSDFLINYTLGTKVAENDWREMLGLDETCTWREVIDNRVNAMLEIVEKALNSADTVAEAIDQMEESEDEESQGAVAEACASFYLEILCKSVAVAFATCATFSYVEDAIFLLCKLCGFIENKHSDENVRRWALRQSRQLEKNFDFIVPIRREVFEKLLLLTEYPRHTIVSAIVDVRIQDVDKQDEFEEAFLAKGLEYFEKPEVIEKIREYEKEAKENE